MTDDDTTRRSLWTRITDSERRFRRSIGRDLSTPRGRRLALLHYHLFDHAFLRFVWTNFAPVADGVYRCNHPTEGRMRRMQRRYSINTILNLRGQSGFASDLFERQAAKDLGQTIVTRGLSAKTAQEPARYLELIDTMRHLPRPFVMHCKSGADRTGLAAAFYLIAIEGRPVSDARRQLSPRFIHFRKSAAGVLDAVLDAYASEGEAAGLGLDQWLAEVYDPARVTERFAKTRRQ